MRNLIVITLALFTLGAVTCLAEAPAGKAASRPQWEYQALTREKLMAMGKNDLTAGLNSAGDEGWELVTIADHNTQWYYFKRAKVGVAPTTTKTAAPAPEAAQPELRLIRLRFATAGEMAKTLQAVFGDRPTPVIVPDSRTNTLILRGPVKNIEEVLVLVRDLDIEGEHKKATPD
jgi:hypothetical protein